MFPSKPTPAPAGGFRRFVIRFCGSTYNTDEHLNVSPGIEWTPPRLSIAGKIYQTMIQQKWFLSYHMSRILETSGFFSGTPGLPGQSSRKMLVFRKHAKSAEGEKLLLRRRLWKPAKMGLLLAAIARGLFSRTYLYCA